MNSIEDIT